MPHKKPEIHLNLTEKSLLLILSKVLIEHLNHDEISLRNFPQNTIVLTDEEAQIISELIEDLIHKKDFIESTLFVENIFSSEINDREKVRELYLSNRKKRGRNRAMATNHWNEIQLRLGTAKDYLRGSSADRMEIKEFFKLEHKLFQSFDLPNNLVDKLMEFVSTQTKNLNDLMINKKSLTRGSIKEVFLKLKLLTDQKDGKPISNKKVYAAVTILANMSCLFTTRDWSAVGTLSSMAGTTAVIFTDDKTE